MGLKNSGQSFQRLIENVLKGLPDVFVYLDDILIFSKSEADHMKTLEELFCRLTKAGLTLSLDKCEFGKNKLDYLGYTISKEGICPIEKKTEAIQNYPIPEKPKQLLAFLGALNYYRASLPNLPPNKTYNYARTPAEVLAPLYHIATADIKPTEFKKVWEGNPGLLHSFNDAKLLLRRAVTLNYPNPQAPISLSTDASKFALGASLDQLIDGVWRPLGFWSKALKPTQQNYSTYRRELMAIMYAMRYFNEMFYGRDLTVFCDHKPIIGTFKSQELQSHDPIALNAIREIGMFTSDIRHKEGRLLTVPDLLSRPAGCPVGRAYRIESENDFENDNFQFKVSGSAKGIIKPDSVRQNPSGGENYQSSAPPSGQFSPSGENFQAESPLSNQNQTSIKTTTTTPSGHSNNTTAPPTAPSHKPPKYISPEVTLAALEQVALQILSPESIHTEQESCPDVMAHRQGNMPRNVKVADVEMLGTTLFCEISDKKTLGPCSLQLKGIL